MRQDNDILSGFAEVLEKVVKVDRTEVTRDKRLRDDFGIDSLSMIDVAVAAEDAFGVPIPDDNIERFETVGDAVDYIQQARVAA